MKKLCIIISLCFILISCWNQEFYNNENKIKKNEIKQQNNNKIINKEFWENKSIKNIMKKTVDIENNNKQEVNIELGKIDLIWNWIKDIWWYKIDCKKEFKTFTAQRECEYTKLKEYWNGCFYKKMWVTLNNIDKIFTKINFDLIDENSIRIYKQNCKTILEEQNNNI